MRKFSPDLRYTLPIDISNRTDKSLTSVRYKLHWDLHHLSIELENMETNLSIRTWYCKKSYGTIFSALSIKSDSGIGGGQSSGLSKFSKLDFATRRGWCSESQLEKKEAGKEHPTASSDKAAATKSSKTRSLGSLFKASELQNYCESIFCAFLLFQKAD